MEQQITKLLTALLPGSLPHYGPFPLRLSIKNTQKSRLRLAVFPVIMHPRRASWATSECAGWLCGRLYLAL